MFDWKEYLHLASALSADGANEAKRRAAISRAYYAAFCAARKHAGMEDDKTPDIHKAVINRYLYSDNENEKQVGFKLKIIKRNRVSADYKDYESIAPSDMEDTIARSEEIFRIIEGG